MRSDLLVDEEESGEPDQERSHPPPRPAEAASPLGQKQREKRKAPRCVPILKRHDVPIDPAQGYQDEERKESSPEEDESSLRRLGPEPAADGENA
jgi:hypothetical protein